MHRFSHDEDYAPIPQCLLPPMERADKWDRADAEYDRWVDEQLAEAYGEAMSREYAAWAETQPIDLDEAFEGYGE